MTQAEIIRQIRVSDHTNLGPLGRAMAVEAEALRDLQVSVKPSELWAAFAKPGQSVMSFLAEWAALPSAERDALVAML